MYAYRNKITGITFESACVCSGDAWESVSAPSAPIKAKETKQKAVDKKETSKRVKK